MRECALIELHMYLFMCVLFSVIPQRDVAPVHITHILALFQSKGEFEKIRSSCACSKAFMCCAGTRLHFKVFHFQSNPEIIIENQTPESAAMVCQELLAIEGIAGRKIVP